MRLCSSGQRLLEPSRSVGSLIDGAIWRGDLLTGVGAVLAEGASGRVSVGIAYEPSRDRLWVAGGGPALFGAGDLRVYDASSGELLVTYTPSGVGFLNNVTITKDALYVTDSIVSELVVISLPANDHCSRRQRSCLSLVTSNRLLAST